MEKKLFGTLKDGKEVSLYSFTNRNNVTMSVTDLGAILVGLTVPDRSGKLLDVVLGYDTPQEYLDHSCYFGAVIGRSGNRIDKAKFVIDGKEYHLAVNDNENNLHCGPDGYEQRVWDVEEIDEAKNSIRFGLASPDGDQGFPGNLRISVTYTLTGDNEVVLHYRGVADADTVVNMTNHSYFNLAGHDSGSIAGQLLQINAQAYTPVRDHQAIPTGELAPVEGTPFDFRTAKPIGRDINADCEQLRFVGGFDHNFVISDHTGEITKMAEAYCEGSGIVMEAFTDCCGMQFYAGNSIVPQTGKGGAAYGKRDGFCLEAQYYPNAINQPGFPSPLLKAGEPYESVTGYRFSVR